MEKGSGVYLVNTDRWYVERLVWLIAGTDVLVSSLLTIVASPNWAFSILFVGICSILVALTGFCIVGTIFTTFGAEPLLSRSGRLPGKKKAYLYFMQTDTWFLERYIYLFVGVNLSLSSLLARFYSPSWLLFTGFVGTATIIFSISGFCIMANFLYRMGAEPRLCRQR